MKPRATRWYYLLPGAVYAYGPTTETFTNARAVRRMILDSWFKDKQRLPRNVQVWRAGA